MSIFVIADLHLSTDSSTNKSMEVFGSRWTDYMSKIQKNWNSIVTENDTVIVPGDISWALKLEEAASDLSYIEKLNGKKFLGKGNHDFWWSTNKKMNEFFKASGFNTLEVLHNNAFIVEGAIICGTRGWFPDESQQTAVNNTDYEKIINREVGRLKISLEAAKKLQDEHFSETGVKLPILVFLHFPPVRAEYSIPELIDVLSAYGIENVYYGHIHNSYDTPKSFTHNNIKFTIISSDFLNFYPLKIQ